MRDLSHLIKEWGTDFPGNIKDRVVSTIEVRGLDSWALMVEALAEAASGNLTVALEVTFDDVDDVTKAKFFKDSNWLSSVFAGSYAQRYPQSIKYTYLKVTAHDAEDARRIALRFFELDPAKSVKSLPEPRTCEISDCIIEHDPDLTGFDEVVVEKSNVWLSDQNAFDKLVAANKVVLKESKIYRGVPESGGVDQAVPGTDKTIRAYQFQVTKGMVFNTLPLQHALGRVLDKDQIVHSIYTEQELHLISKGKLSVDVLRGVSKIVQKHKVSKADFECDGFPDLREICPLWFGKLARVSFIDVVAGRAVSKDFKYVGRKDADDDKDVFKPLDVSDDDPGRWISTDKLYRDESAPTSSENRAYSYHAKPGYLFDPEYIRDAIQASYLRDFYIEGRYPRQQQVADIIFTRPLTDHEARMLSRIVRGGEVPEGSLPKITCENNTVVGVGNSPFLGLSDPPNEYFPVGSTTFNNCILDPAYYAGDTSVPIRSVDTIKTLRGLFYDTGGNNPVGNDRAIVQLPDGPTLYRYEPKSTMADDGKDVVSPINKLPFDAGRWLRVVLPTTSMPTPKDPDVILTYRDGDHFNRENVDITALTRELEKSVDAPLKDVSFVGGRLKLVWDRPQGFQPDEKEKIDDAVRKHRAPLMLYGGEETNTYTFGIPPGFKCCFADLAHNIQMTPGLVRPQVVEAWSTHVDITFDGKRKLTAQGRKAVGQIFAKTLQAPRSGAESRELLDVEKEIALTQKFGPPGHKKGKRILRALKRMSLAAGVVFALVVGGWLAFTFGFDAVSYLRSSASLPTRTPHPVDLIKPAQAQSEVELKK